MKRILLVALVVVAALTVAAVALGATIISVPADKTKLAFSKKALTASAGKVTLRMKNPQRLKHNIAIRSGTTRSAKIIAKGKTVGKNKVSTVTVTLKKGKYRYVCTVPAHEAGGMWGILTVK